ncbi:hypothetical protein ES703_69498 [subsurface metagenome]
MNNDEARAKYHDAVKKGNRKKYYGLTYWSPNINIFRDPRWGRGQETYGEDPYLTGELAVEFVKGLQGDDTKYLKLIATPKHFAVHSGPEEDRHYFNAIVSKKDMEETYLPALRKCVIEGNAYSVMGAYNRVNGEPYCASKTLLLDILRNKWGFKGYVDYFGAPAGVTTYTSTKDLGGLYSLDNWGSGDVCGQFYFDSSQFDNVKIAIGLSLVGELDAVISGERDENIEKLGEWIKKAARPVFLRIGYEYEGEWNSYKPEKYKKGVSSIQFPIP